MRAGLTRCRMMPAIASMMDNPRLFLFIALSFVFLLMWEAWQRDYGTPMPVESPVSEAAAPAPADGSLPAEDLPIAGETGPVADQAAKLSLDEALLKRGERVRVITDVLDIEIDTVGGDLRRAVLLKYPIKASDPDTSFELLNDRLPNIFVAQSGLRTPDGEEPTHHARYSAEQSEYRLQAGQSELSIPLRWTSPQGIEVTKLYRLRPGSYVIDVEHQVRNGSAAEWRGREYRQLQRTQIAEYGQSQFIYTYMGGVIYSPEEKYEKISFEDMVEANLSRSITDGWAAMIQHYFVAAWIPPASEPDQYYTKVLSGQRYVLGLIANPVAVPPGDEKVFASRLYVGPKLQDTLGSVAPGLELTVDYGVLTVLAKPIFWLLEKIHSLTGNWGWSIILLTLVIKLAFYKLSETSYKSMANMRKLAPRLQALKERYGDDKQKLNHAMMDMYKKEKINPLGGCLPIVVQIPVFISLYWVLLESVELRQAPFMLWLNDLSSADPFYVLPLIMGITMFIQQKLNPAPLDPVQAKVMMVLPVVFTVFFAFFPSGLVLYWVTNNTLSIAQQWVITKRVEQGAA
jgi:YidC/Oxa1 family membrane protein insertase